jgi:hypothetical protein
LITASAQSDLREKAFTAFQNFTSMNESERMNAVANMTSNEIEKVMMVARSDKTGSKRNNSGHESTRIGKGYYPSVEIW